MSDTGMAPFEPDRILGCSPREALKITHGRKLSLGEVEALALDKYQWWRHLRDPRSYWVTASQASRLLHISPSVVRRLLDQERLPYVVHSSGVRLMRRHEILRLSEHGSTPDLLT
jgi:hypothetical protein